LSTVKKELKDVVLPGGVIVKNWIWAFEDALFTLVFAGKNIRNTEGYEKAGV